MFDTYHERQFKDVINFFAQDDLNNNRGMVAQSLEITTAQLRDLRSQMDQKETTPERKTDNSVERLYEEHMSQRRPKQPEKKNYAFGRRTSSNTRPVGKKRATPLPNLYQSAIVRPPTLPRGQSEIKILVDKVDSLEDYAAHTSRLSNEGFIEPTIGTANVKFGTPRVDQINRGKKVPALRKLYSNIRPKISTNLAGSQG